jgi:hypothetical protein
MVIGHKPLEQDPPGFAGKREVSTLETKEPQQPQYDFVKGEQVLWNHRISKGVLHREVVEEWIITNMRVMKRYPESKNNPARRISFVGLGTDCDVVVMNQRRQSQGARVGNFVGTAPGGGSFGGVTSGTSSSTSRTYDDLVILLGGKERLRFSGISDPHGVKRMIDTMKKQVHKHG